MYPDEFLTPATPGQIFMIIECPSSRIRDLLVKNTEFFRHQLLGDLKAPHVIIHMTSQELVESEPYLSWMEQFGSSTKHVLLNNHGVTQWTPFLRSVEFQTKLSAIDSEVFPCLPKNQTPAEDHNFPENYIIAENLLGYQFRPLRKEGLTRRNVRVVFNVENTFAKSKAVLASLDERTLKDITATTFTSSKDVQLQHMCDCKVTFLGTGSSMPCYFRNHSAVLLHTRCVFFPFHLSPFATLLVVEESTYGARGLVYHVTKNHIVSGVCGVYTTVSVLKILQMKPFFK